MHGGESYIVNRLDLDTKVAYVEKTEVNYYTSPGSRTWASVDESVQYQMLGSVRIDFGDVVVGNQVTHFWRRQLFSDENLDKVILNLPETQLNTEGIWLSIPEELTNKLIGRNFDLLGTIHAVEHTCIGILPLFALCDRSDIGGVSHPQHADTDGLAAIFIYDGRPGGVGIARVAYERIEELLAAALKTIDDCPCEDGCPSCIQSPKCGNNNEPLDKAGAAYLIREILAQC